MILIIRVLVFLLLKKIIARLKKKNICINAFCYENDLVYPDFISKQKFENCMDLLIINDENKSHYVYIKDFSRFMFNKTKHKNKNTFADIVYSVLMVIIV